MKTNEIKKLIKEYRSEIKKIQKSDIHPLEKRIVKLLMVLYPSLAQDAAEDWMLDIAYNDPNAMERMEELFGGKK